MKNYYKFFLSIDLKSNSTGIPVLLIVAVLGLTRPAVAQPCLDSSKVYSFQFDGHRYDIVQEQKSWQDAARCARRQGGHLVHINDSLEQAALTQQLRDSSGISLNYTSVTDGGGAAYIWIGATDKDTEGDWIWDGDDTLGEANFWQGQGSAGNGNGAPVMQAFHNWGGKSQSGGPSEPDDFGAGQDGGAMALQSWPFGNPFEWNDIQLSNSLYYVIEYAANFDLEENVRVNNWQVYPNPAGSIVELKSAGNQRIKFLELISPAGYLVWKKHTEVNGPGSYTFNLDEIPAGVYFLKIHDTDGQQSIKKLRVR